MEIVLNSKLVKEEQVVAELSCLGITYLSRLTNNFTVHPRAGWALLADLVRQPSSRVRCATIALLLEHPEYSEHIPLAVKMVRSKNRLTLKLFYMAAVYLQRIYSEELKQLQGQLFCWLPDLFSLEFSIQPGLDPVQSLSLLGKRHQTLTGIYVNWSGTYKNVVEQLLKRKKLEMLWNQ